MKTKSCKAKGRNLQNLVRDKLLHQYEGILDDTDIRGAIMGESGEDIVFSTAAKKELGISIECKSHKAFAVYKHYEQAERNCGGREPVLVIKGNHKQPLVVLDLNYFLELL